VVKLMLARGANQDAKDKYGRTPLSRAEAHGYKDVIRFLSSSQ
jgi:ankyrin repeat protein